MLHEWVGVPKVELWDVEHGYNPRWSPNGKYIAVANTYSAGGERVFDGTTGAEVLRVTGSPSCLGDFWLAGNLLAYGYGGLAVTVPSGEIVQAPPLVNSAGAFDQSVSAGTTRLLLDAGGSVEFRSEAPWSAYYDGEGVHLVLTDGRALFLIGVGGKGLCDGRMDELSVQLPPFS